MLWKSVTKRSGMCMATPSGKGVPHRPSGKAFLKRNATRRLCDMHRTLQASDRSGSKKLNLNALTVPEKQHNQHEKHEVLRPTRFGLLIPLISYGLRYLYSIILTLRLVVIFPLFVFHFRHLVCSTLGCLKTRRLVVEGVLFSMDLFSNKALSGW